MDNTYKYNNSSYDDEDDDVAELKEKRTKFWEVEAHEVFGVKREKHNKISCGYDAFADMIINEHVDISAMLHASIFPEVPFPLTWHGGRSLSIHTHLVRLAKLRWKSPSPGLPAAEQSARPCWLAGLEVTLRGRRGKHIEEEEQDRQLRANVTVTNRVLLQPQIDR